MPETNRTARITISIPADLKRRMRKIKEGVNWSALACAGFEAELARMTASQEGNGPVDENVVVEVSREPVRRVALTVHQRWVRDAEELGKKRDERELLRRNKVAEAPFKPTIATSQRPRPAAK